MAASNIRKLLIVSLIGTATLVGGCAPITQNHGYVPLEAEIAAIQAGFDTRDSVYARLGEPTTKGVEGDSSWYYVSYVERRLAFLPPKITSREILAISFDARGRVAAVDRYGIEDGILIDLNTRETVTGGRKLTFLQQLIGNIGNFSAESFL